MKPRQRLPYPGAEALTADKAEGLSNVKIAHKYGVSSQTVHRWMVKAGLEGELPSDQPDHERFATLVKKPEQSQEGEQVLLPAQLDAPITLQPPIATLPVAGQPTSQLQHPQDDDEPAFNKLSSTQKKAVAILVDRPDIKGRELADLVGVSEATITAWKQSLYFQDAVKELLIPAFKLEALTMLVADLRRVIQSNKSRPEDRKLLAELSGMTAGDQVNVQVNLDQSGFFGAKYRR